MSKADISITPIRSRRAVLAGIVSAVVIPTTTAPAMAENRDAELIEFGARLEPLIDQNYVARKRWSRASCAGVGVYEADDALSAICEEMRPLENAINAASVTSIEGLRAKALVAFREVAPVCSYESEFSLEDAYPFQQLFTAVAELCGLKDKMAATGYELPDIAIAADSDEESDDEGGRQ